MTVYELCELFNDGATVEIFSLDKCETVFKGYSDEMPENIGESIISSIDPVNKGADFLTVNIECIE